MNKFLLVFQKEEYKSFFLFCLSWAIVAFGTPAWSMTLAPLASTVGFALFWLSIDRLEKKRLRFFVACLWFALVQAIQLSWFASVRYQGYYILFVYLGLIVWLGLQFGVIHLLFSKRNFRLVHVWLVASLWVFIEIIRLFVFCGFAFNPLGLSLCYSVYSSQWLSVVGIYGMSFLVMVTNGLFYLFLIKRKKRFFVFWAILALFPYVFSCFHLSYHKEKRQKLASNPITVGLVQTGLKPDEKMPTSNKSLVFVPLYQQWIRIFSYFSKEKVDSFDYIVLPETAICFGAKTPLYPLEEVSYILQHLLGQNHKKYWPKQENPFFFLIEDNWYVSNAFWSQVLSNKYQSKVVIGLDDFDEKDNKSYNAAFYFSPHNHGVFRYEKRVLVPLAEYLPLNFLKPLVARYGITGEASHGKEMKIFGDKLKVAPSICYEECFGHLMTKNRKKGAQIFVNMSNDAWYFPSKLPLQHFFHGRLRAIENGVDVLRACNTGITAIVNSLGESVAVFHGVSSEAQYKQGLLTASLQPYSYFTLYSCYGDFGISSLCFIIVMFCIYDLSFFKKWKMISTDRKITF